MRVGIIGCGALGAYIGRAIKAGKAGPYEMVSLMDANPESAAALSSELACAAASTIDDFLSAGPELVIEAARREAVWDHARACLTAGASLILLSSGALAEKTFKASLEESALKAGKKVYVPSGAVGGLDLLRAAATGNATVTLETTKPPRALRGAPYTKSMDLDAIKMPETIFSGSVSDAIDAFPQNVNVAVSTALAAGDIDRATTSVIADPAIDTNIHKIIASGDFGQATIEIMASPIPGNPKSSQLAAMSVVALLKRLASPIEIGG